MTLQHVIEGDNLDVTQPAQVTEAGAVLARLHDDLARYPRAERFRQSSPDTGGTLTDRVAGWLEGDRPHIPAALRAPLRKLLRDAPAEQTPHQLVHGDHRAANILCADSRVAAVIDLEEARFDHPVAELARSAVLLGTLFRGWGPVSSQVREDFLAGYQSQRKLTEAELRWWDVLVGWNSLAMIPPDPTRDTTGWPDGRRGAPGAHRSAEVLRRGELHGGDCAPEHRRQRVGYRARMSGVEWWDILDESGDPTGERFCRGRSGWPSGRFHLIVATCVVRGDGSLLLTRRAATKEFPRAWEFPGGSALAGESSRRAARREVHEETGVVVPEDGLELVDRFRETSALLDMYVAALPGTPSVTVDPAEVDAAAWVAWSDVEDRLSTGRMAEPWVDRLRALGPGLKAAVAVAVGP